jgi:hypothetical protein
LGILDYFDYQTLKWFLYHCLVKKDSGNFFKKTIDFLGILC